MSPGSHSPGPGHPPYVPKLTRLQSSTVKLNSSTLYSFSIGTFAPNGDILAANDSANGNWVYAYDAFNRLTCSNLASNGTCASPTNGNASYTYVYDRFGNRWQQNSHVSGGSSFLATFTGNNPGNPQNNNRMDGYSYDTAGNVLNDGTHSYFYDAENRITKVDNGATATYVYDANGQRVQKTTTTGNPSDPAGTWIFVYDQSGRMVQEFNSPGNTFVRGHIYAGGRHLAMVGGSTTFSHSDWLGTERFRTQMATNPYSYESCSSLPFGDGLTCTGSDQDPLHFTGKERDAATGLDNFGARYDASSMGRFMSPDELGPGQHPENPQTWNLFSYVLNNPLKLVDPSGEFTCDAKTVSNAECDKFQEALDKAQGAADKLGEKYGWDSEQYLNAQRAIDSYGDEGIDNGVVIAQGDAGGYGASTTDARKAFPGEKILVTLDKAQDAINSNDLPIIAAHEGTHVADDMSSLTKGRSDTKWVNLGLSPGLPQTILQFELKAFTVGFNIAEGLGRSSLSLGKFDFSLPLTPAGIDRAEIMIKTDYKNWNMRIFQRNTNPSRSQR